MKRSRRGFLGAVLALAGAATVVPKDAQAATWADHPYERAWLDAPNDMQCRAVVNGAYCRLPFEHHAREMPRLRIEDGVAEMWLGGVLIDSKVTEPKPYGENVWLRREGVAQPSGDIKAGAASRQATGIVMEQGESLHWGYDAIRLGPLTFEAMQADCAARGCLLDFKHAAGGLSTHVLTHVQREADEETRWAGFDYHGEGSEQWLARVDSWRRSLHGGEQSARDDVWFTARIDLRRAAIERQLIAELDGDLT